MSASKHDGDQPADNDSALAEILFHEQFSIPPVSDGLSVCCYPRTVRSTADLSAILLLLGLRMKAQILTVDRVINPADHHLFPGLIAPAHCDGRIGVEFVACGIVVVRDTFDAAALRHGNRLFDEVGKLPVEIIFRHAQQNFLGAVGKNELVLEIFAAHVHMRHE